MCFFFAHSPFNSQFLLFCKLFYFYFYLLLYYIIFYIFFYLFIIIFSLLSLLLFPTYPTTHSLFLTHTPHVSFPIFIHYFSFNFFFPLPSPFLFHLHSSSLFFIFLFFYFFFPIPKARWTTTPQLFPIFFYFLFSLQHSSKGPYTFSPAGFSRFSPSFFPSSHLSPLSARPQLGERPPLFFQSFPHFSISRGFLSHGRHLTLKSSHYFPFLFSPQTPTRRPQDLFIYLFFFGPSSSLTALHHTPLPTA